MTRTLLIYGDSNTHGTKPLAELGAFDRYERGVPWPDVMAQDLPDWHVITEALPGRTTVLDDPVWGLVRNGLTVLPAVLLSHVPLDAVIIVLGTNDLKKNFDLNAKEIAASAVRLGQEVQAQTECRQIAIVSPLPVKEAGCLAEVFAQVDMRQRNLAVEMEKAARAAGFGFFDFAPLGAVSDVDGVHWEAETHKAVGQAAAAFVRETWG